MEQPAENLSVPELRRPSVTVVLSNRQAELVAGPNGPVLVKTFAHGDEWQQMISDLVEALESCDDVDVCFIGEGVDPVGLDPHDAEESHRGRAAAAVATYPDGSLDRLRAALQAFLKESTVSHCWVHASAPAGRDVLYGRDLIGSLDELVEAEGCDDVDELLERIDDHTDGKAWIDWDGTDDENLTICIGRCGVSLDYPFTAGKFWDAVVELDEADQASFHDE